MDYILTDNGLKLVDSTVVMLPKYPGTKWITKKGWYCYQGDKYNGWYFSSIPSQTVIPVDQEDLAYVVIISDESGCCPPPPFPPPPPPTPYPPYPPCPDPSHRPEPFTKADKEQLLSAFITVKNKKDLYKINTDNIPAGKLVRVNDVDGSPKYYSYDKEKDDWVEDFFGNAEAVTKLDERVSQLENDSSWLDINKEVIN